MGYKAVWITSTIHLWPVRMPLSLLRNTNISSDQPGWFGFWLFCFVSFCFKLFYGVCQNLLLMLLLGNAAQNVCFNLSRHPKAEVTWTTQTKIFSFPCDTVWLSQQAKCIDTSSYSCFLSLQFSESLVFRATLFVVGSIWLQLMHLLQKRAKMTLYNYSIISPYSMHGSDQHSYKNKMSWQCYPLTLFFYWK